MSAKSHITLAAFVSAEEKAALQLAANHLARVLTQAAAAPWTCDCVFSPDLESLRPGSESAILVGSLLPELEKMSEPWPVAEKRLRKTYAALGELGAPVFICTILRHVDRDEDAAAREALKIRIRRLNLLAAEISHESGVYVIDLDRVLADIGAHRLQTDCRLKGSAAVSMAGHAVALTLVRNAVDALVSYEVQDAAAELLASSRPSIPELNGVPPAVNITKNLTAVGRGRRKQIVSHVVHAVEENNVDWLIRQVRQGAIGPSEAFQRLVQAVRRRGVRESVGLVKAGLLKQIDRKKSKPAGKHGK